MAVGAPRHVDRVCVLEDRVTRRRPVASAEKQVLLGILESLLGIQDSCATFTALSSSLPTGSGTQARWVLSTERTLYLPEIHGWAQ